MENNLKKGDVIKVCRKNGLYYHYGVYVGNGQVVHFSADTGNGEQETNAMNADIIKTDLKSFKKDGIVVVDNAEQAQYSGEEIASRAESLIGTQKSHYDLALNNCEHFANWCKTGSKISNQVNKVQEIVPNGKEILEGYKTAKNTVTDLVEVFKSQKITQEQVEEQIDYRTQEILNDYEYADSTEKTNEWIADKIYEHNPVLRDTDYVKKYHDEVDLELDYYDGYKQDLNNYLKKGGSVIEWFKKDTQNAFEKNVYGYEEIRNLPPSKRAEVFPLIAQTDVFTELENDDDYVLIQEDPPYNSGKISNGIKMWSNLNPDNEENIRNTKKSLNTAIQLSCSKFGIEVPNTITVPVSSCAVNCGVSVKKCIRGDIKPIECVKEIGKEVVVAGKHIITRAADYLLQKGTQIVTNVIGKKLIGKTVTSIAKQGTSAFRTEFKNSVKTHNNGIKSNLQKLGTILKAGAKAVVKAGRSLISRKR